MDNGYRYGQPETCFPYDSAAQSLLQEESTEMTHKQMVQEAMKVTDHCNDCIQDEIFCMFEVALSTGEISDIRNDIEMEKLEKYAALITPHYPL